MHCILCIALLCIALLCFALHYFALLCFALLCFALLCIAVHCFALHCFALLCFALLCFALHYFALHCLGLRAQRNKFFLMFFDISYFFWHFWLFTLGRGTRLWRPGEPRGGRFLGEPGARAGRSSSPVALVPSKNPFRQSLIGEQLNQERQLAKQTTFRMPISHQGIVNSKHDRLETCSHFSKNTNRIVDWST